MEDENRWQHLEKHLLAHLTRAGLADLHGLRLREVRKCVLDGVYRIRLQAKDLEVSLQDICMVDGQETDLDVEFE